jgi:CRP/FNR family transcriptional regulator
MLPAVALRDLESIMSIVDYEAGRILFLEQETLSQVFVVLAGDVRLSLQDVGGRRLTLRIARPGDVLGMHSALFGSLSEWSADTVYREVSRLATLELMTIHRNACVTLRIVGLTTCVRKRLASQLLEWGQRGEMTGDQTQFRMALTHSQIAEFIGAARETVTRALIAFKQRGLVEIRGSMLRIPSTTALRKYAERGH